MGEKKWYVLRTAGGKEKKAKEYLEKEIERSGLQNQVEQVLVPVEKKYTVKNGKRVSVEKLLFPGYVLINMVMNDETWYIVRNTRGVTGFVGPGSKPVPLTADEMRPFGIDGGVVTGAPKPRMVVDFEPGDMVVVIAGAWEDTTGVITQVNPQKQTVTINVELFGRETPVEINFAEVKKK